jgi:hypothetical protein
MLFAGVSPLADAGVESGLPAGPRSLLGSGDGPDSGLPEAGGGTRPPATDGGTDERPILWPARRLTDHVRATAMTIPSTALTVHTMPRRLMVMTAGP